MITEYFSTEELEHELKEDRKALMSYLKIRTTKLKREVKRSRKNKIIRLLPWISERNNRWYYKEELTKLGGGKFLTTHGITFCFYTYNGKLRASGVYLSQNKEAEELHYWHFSYHFFHRLKQRMNWKLSIEESAKKFMRSFCHSAVSNLLEKHENGTVPMLAISSFGLLLGIRRIDYLPHYWITTFLSTNTLNENKKGVGRELWNNIHKGVDKWPEELVDTYKKEVHKLINKFYQSVPELAKGSKATKQEK